MIIIVVSWWKYICQYSNNIFAALSNINRECRQSIFMNEFALSNLLKSSYIPNTDT